MRMCLPRVSLCLLAALSHAAFAAGRGKAGPDMQQGRGALATSGVRPFAAPAEARAEMALACRDHISLVSYRPYRRLRSKGVHLCAKAADVRLDYCRLA